jgi:hypothetical protein
MNRKHEHKKKESPSSTPSEPHINHNQALPISKTQV